jgi:hypothetical protein
VPPVGVARPAAYSAQQSPHTPSASLPSTARQPPPPSRHAAPLQAQLSASQWQTEQQQPTVRRRPPRPVAWIRFWSASECPTPGSGTSWRGRGLRTRPARLHGTPARMRPARHPVASRLWPAASSQEPAACAASQPRARAAFLALNRYQAETQSLSCCVRRFDRVVSFCFSGTFNVLLVANAVQPRSISPQKVKVA